jgi:hypothetical protein
MVKKNSLTLRPLIRILCDPFSTTNSQSPICLLASVQSRFLRVRLIIFYSKKYTYICICFSVTSLSANVLYSVKVEALTRKWVEVPMGKKKVCDLIICTDTKYSMRDF